MTVIEAVVAGAVLALVLWLVAGWYSQMLDRAREDQAAALIRTLDAALAAYHEFCGAYPPGRGDGAAHEAIEALLSVPDSSRLLAKIEVKLLHVRDGRPVCRDPWGQRPRYLTARIENTDLRRRVERNNGQPILESAGPDGRFGDADPAAAADDICSDEPGV
ncbi:MAG: hypothetical protein ACYSUQ_13355 [Planctomycetota bacterium]|jgi:type II secretory pathway pseudopilin PulG